MSDRARFLDRLLAEHDRLEPTCSGTLYESTAQWDGEISHVGVRATCTSCHRRWEWMERVDQVLNDGRRLRERNSDAA